MLGNTSWNRPILYQLTYSYFASRQVRHVSISRNIYSLDEDMNLGDAMDVEMNTNAARGLICGYSVLHHMFDSYLLMVPRRSD